MSITTNKILNKNNNEGFLTSEIKLKLKKIEVLLFYYIFQFIFVKKINLKNTFKKITVEHVYG